MDSTPELRGRAETRPETDVLLDPCPRLIAPGSKHTQDAESTYLISDVPDQAITLRVRCGDGNGWVLIVHAAPGPDRFMQRRGGITRNKDPNPLDELSEVHLGVEVGWVGWASRPWGRPEAR